MFFWETMRGVCDDGTSFEPGDCPSAILLTTFTQELEVAFFLLGFGALWSTFGGPKQSARVLKCQTQAQSHDPDSGLVLGNIDGYA